MDDGNDDADVDFGKYLLGDCDWLDRLVMVIWLDWEVY